MADEQDVERPEDLWNRITAGLAQVPAEELWDRLASMVEYRGGDAEQNLTLAGLVHTLADRDGRAREAFEAWKKGPSDPNEPAGHVATWMLHATGQLDNLRR